VCLGRDFYILSLGLLSARGWHCTPHTARCLRPDRSPSIAWAGHDITGTSAAGVQTGGPAAGRETGARRKLQTGDCYFRNLIIQGSSANYSNRS